MADPFIGEIRMVGFNFAPSGWALCNGQLMAISQNEALYTLLGTTYGGDGVTTFGLPNMQSRIPLNQGSPPFGGSFVLGQMAGVESVTLLQTQIPAHSHLVQATTAAAGNTDPAGNAFATPPQNNFNAGPANVILAPTTVGNAGGNAPHDNIMPYQCINFVISLFGIFPSQN